MKYKNKYNLKTWLITMLKQVRTKANAANIEKEIQRLKDLQNGK